MKLKIKLPLLFVLMFVLLFVLIVIFLVLYIKSLGEIANGGHTWQGNILSPLHSQMLLLLSILMGLMFIFLSVYFHFHITKPIQLLNTRLTQVNIGHSRTSLFSRRKDEIGELYNHFNEMEERLYQAHKEKVEMIAAIAHDLKTPLTSITGFVELLSMQKNLSEKEKQEYYELVFKKSKHMVELIDAFSTFTNEEVTLETIEMNAVEAYKMFEDIAAEYETELSSFDYRLKWSCILQ